MRVSPARCFDPRRDVEGLDQLRRRPAARPTVDGKFFRVDDERFFVRGVTYGTFAPTDVGMFPDLARVRRDFAAMAEAGINTVRTYTLPDRCVLDAAADERLHVLVGMWWGDPRRFERPTVAAWNAMADDARAMVHDAAADFGDHPAVLGFVVGNEVPASALRWFGRKRFDALLRSLHGVGKVAAPQALFGYATYPTTGYVDTSCFEFDCVNVFLEDESAYRRYLAQRQLDTGNRPLVVSEMGLDAASHGERRQAEVLDWQLRVGMEAGLAGSCVFAWTDDWWVDGSPVAEWCFGVTDADRRPKPAVDVVAARYHSGLLGCRSHWPRATVVVCAYNEEHHIRACVESLTRLRYPDYEVIVVDDGSDDQTAALARQFPVRVASEGRQGLSGARNLGLRLATGEIVAYIDADACADPDWLTYLALALAEQGVAGAGGPNLSPQGDPPVAQCIGLAPGNPIHVLIDDERAEHLPGCNMAFWRGHLLEIGGFDPMYRTAGDDLDICWRLLDRGHTLRFHPSAVVWHHPRQGVRQFWRQQLGYGRAEALVARAHPDKINGLGQAVWSGVVYGPGSLLPRRARVYAGAFGEAPFQRLYANGRALPLAPPLWLIAGLVGAALVEPRLVVLLVASLALVPVVALATSIAIARRHRLRPAWACGALIALLHLAQPVARALGRRQADGPLPPPEAPTAALPTLRPAGRRHFTAEPVAAEDRSAAVEALAGRLRAGRLRVLPASSWSEEDVHVEARLCWQARLVAYVHEHRLYVRVDRRARRAPVALACALGAGVLAVWAPAAGLAAAGGLVTLCVVDGWLLGRRVRTCLSRPSAQERGSQASPRATVAE